ncbi:MAG TPA: hypothetical protein VFY29_02865 [Terriglobia bacterium]|nr:hypothetical protein [Terriglobia bacterium]
MNRRRVQLLVMAALALAALVPTIRFSASAPLERLPARLTDQEFWKVSSDASESGGEFHSENLVSNELRFQSIVPSLMKTAVPGRAYVGVGSEQNFTYIAATRPSIAFVVDLRRGNLNLHLIYKAFFELSSNRVEFVSRLFSRPKPSGLGPGSSVSDIFAAYGKAAPSQALYDQNLKEIKANLTTRHGFKLSKDDLESIDFVYSNWFRYGPELRYELTNGFGGANFPTYADLMTTTDTEGNNRSYLASEESFAMLKDLQQRNLIIPVVGNFGGPKALRAVAAYLKQKETLVSVFYTSNVEQYLRQDGIWENFCKSSATFPMDDKSLFVRSARAGFSGQREVVGANGNFNLEMAPMKKDVADCRP